MIEPRHSDVPPGALTAAATVLICAAVVAAGVLTERAYNRWSKEHHPLTGPRERVTTMKTTYRRKRANAGEVGQVLGGVFVGVSRA